MYEREENMVKSRILSLTSKEVIVTFMKGNSKGAER